MKNQIEQESIQKKLAEIEKLLREIKEKAEKVEEEQEEAIEDVEEKEELIEEFPEEEREEKEEISRKTAFKNPWFYVSVIAVIIIVLLAYKFVIAPNPIETGSAILNNPGNNQANNVAPSEKVSVSADDDAFLGNENAPVTIIEFSDYQCPFCERFYSNTLPSLKKEYIDTGKVKLVYRDFPLSFHENAQKAAEAAETARELGGDDAYWKMHDKIFENQGALSREDLIAYAKQISLDDKKFTGLLDSSKYRNEVQKDFADGQSAGVQGTPTFFVNGRILVGAQPFEAFKQIIEEELAK